MMLSDAVQDDLNFLRHEQRAVKTTVRTYQNGLRLLLARLPENGVPQPTLFHFCHSTSAPLSLRPVCTGVRPRTLRGRMCPIKSLAAFLVK